MIETKMTTDEMVKWIDGLGEWLSCLGPEDFGRQTNALPAIRSRLLAADKMEERVKRLMDAIESAMIPITPPATMCSIAYERLKAALAEKGEA